jgi:hypothetical protein
LRLFDDKCCGKCKKNLRIAFDLFSFDVEFSCGAAVYGIKIPPFGNHAGFAARPGWHWKNPFVRAAR